MDKYIGFDIDSKKAAACVVETGTGRGNDRFKSGRAEICVWLFCPTIRAFSNYFKTVTLTLSEP